MIVGYETLDKFIQETQNIGGGAQAHTNNLYGINQTMIKQPIALGRNLMGYTFFTRPQLNLQDDNLLSKRMYFDYLTKNETSINRYIRTMLDPRLQYSNIQCPLTDPLNAFIPILTNQVETVSGWPDIVLPTYTSAEGLRKNQYSQPDGIIDIYSAYDLDVTFRNSADRVIIKMMHLWLMYMGDVFRGHLSPYTDFLVENERDFDTRIYRLTMTQDNKRVAMIFSTGVSFPLNVPMGKFADFTSSTPYGEQTKEINIRFKSLGACYMDPVLVREFNDTVSIFNPTMKQINKGEGQSTYGIIPQAQMQRLRNRGYPRINPATAVLEWWCETGLINGGN